MRGRLEKRHDHHDAESWNVFQALRAPSIRRDQCLV